MLGPVQLISIDDNGTTMRINYAQENGKDGYLDGDHRAMGHVLITWELLGRPEFWIDRDDEEGPMVHFIAPKEEVAYVGY